MSQEKKKLQFVQKYYIREEDGSIDYEHPYDLIKEPDSEGLYKVVLDGQVGYMDANGKLVVPIKYDDTRITWQGTKQCGCASWYPCGSNYKVTNVYKNNLVGLINDRGEELVPCQFEDVAVFNWLTSENFIPIALPSKNNDKLLWGMYDVKSKRVSVTPAYEEIQQERYGYASFNQNGKWGLVHCATGTVVIPAEYLLEMYMTATGVIVAYKGKSWCYRGRAKAVVDPEECHVWVVNGPTKPKLVVSGYDWITTTVPNVVSCEIGHHHKPDLVDSFKILRQQDYVVLIKNATYEAGYLLEETGEFVKEWNTKCTTCSLIPHAKYISGGEFSAIAYNGMYVPVTDIMQKEILQYLRDECFSS